MKYPNANEVAKLLEDKFQPERNPSDPNCLPGSNILKTYELTPPKEIAGCTVEISGVYMGVENKDTILLDVDKKVIPVMRNQTTFYSSPITGDQKKHHISKGDRLYIIAVEARAEASDEPVNIALTVILEDEKRLFEQVESIYGRAAAIRDFYTMFKDQPKKQQTIADLIDAPKYHRYDPNQDTVFSERAEQLLKFALTRETYPVETQRAIDGMFSLRHPGMNKSSNKLDFLSNITPEWKGRRELDEKRFSENWDKTFYGRDKAKEIILDVLVSKKRANKRGFIILLVGSPGVAKTSIMLFVANEYNVPAEIIPLDGVSTPIDLNGLPSTYSDSDGGRFSQAFRGHGTSEMMLGLDELDKMCTETKEGNPMNTLYNVLCGKLDDKFLGCPISMDNTIIIATANSTESIPDSILNRFDAVIHLDDYTVEDKIIIAKRHIIPEIMSNYDEHSIRFSDDVIRHIAEKYCADAGARDLRHNIDFVTRRIIRTRKSKNIKWVTKEEVNRILKPVLQDKPGIFFNTHKDEYAETVADEIKKCLIRTTSSARPDADRFSVEKDRERLEYLLCCRTGPDIKTEVFDPEEFKEKIHKDIFGNDDTINEVTRLFYSLSLKGDLQCANLALHGGFGVGKTAIAKNIADAIGYNFAKISLNGVSDMRDLRGFSKTFIGSGPGRIMKAVKDAGSYRTVFLLDEIDKLRPDMATVLVDLLDRSYVDTFLGVPSDFKNSLFIATANDWSKVPAVIKDRFIVVDVKGYTRSEKAVILSDYVIPKIERGYVACNVSIDLDSQARDTLLKTYCKSFGIRDVEKSMQKIVSNKLREQSGQTDASIVKICKEDVLRILGQEPIPRGNFLKDCFQPGIAKALAVSDMIFGSAFAIETVLIDGNELLEITGLPKESAIDSVKIAVSCIKKMYPELLTGKEIHVHFGEGSVPKDGPSAGTALFMSIYSAAIGKPLMIKEPYDIAYTGELSLTGGVFAVGGVYEKIQAAADSGVCKVFIPSQNYERLDKEILKTFDCEVVPVNHISQVVQAVFG